MMKDVCGAICPHDDHDPDDEWVCTLDSGHGIEHAAVVIGGWHHWTDRYHEHEVMGPPVERLTPGQDRAAVAVLEELVRLFRGGMVTAEYVMVPERLGQVVVRFGLSGMYLDSSVFQEILSMSDVKH